MRALVPLVHESGINPESYLNPLGPCNMQEDGAQVGSSGFGQDRPARGGFNMVPMGALIKVRLSFLSCKICQSVNHSMSLGVPVF